MKRGIEDFEPHKIYESVKQYYLSLPSDFRPSEGFLMFMEMEKSAYYASVVTGCEMKKIFQKGRKPEQVYARCFIAWYCFEVLFMPRSDVYKYLHTSSNWYFQTYSKFLNLPEHDEYKKKFKRFKQMIEEDPEL